jgi:aminopeptidase N
VRIAPARNTALEGLYASGPFLLTQCEAQGFRRITWFVDRPDVMARYDVTLRGARADFPVLLSNGDVVDAGTLPDGRHWARWVDPHPKPSYLFALAAGRLERLEDSFTTAEGRRVRLAIHAEADAIGRCAHAMAALKRAMAWDERRYGRCYDLDCFNIVATHDFNMGAMENKGLNIFNARYIVGDAATATDDDLLHVEAVVAHEYLHNWTGNRITCRDWFQLSLKEGLTVFREQQFVADTHSRAVRRIDDVRALRSQQFAEDAGPFAHPVRPDSYVEINNFYTATVYEKGAEIVRMLHTVLGEDAFRAGMDEYFRRHDGQAVTCDDFTAALGAGAGADLAEFGRWYAQAGTPQLRCTESWDAVAGRFVLEFAQSTPPTPGQPHKLPLPIPVRLALFDPAGQRLPLQLAGEPAGQATERVILLRDAAQRLVFHGIEAPPVASLLRDHSAPVRLLRQESPEQLAFLARHDDDAFNRWEAIQRLGEHALLCACTAREVEADGWRGALFEALGALLREPGADPAFVAECLLPPDEAWLGERLEDCDPDQVHEAREHLRAALGTVLATPLDAAAGDRRDAPGPRRLRNMALGLRAAADPAVCTERLAAQYATAANLTDRLAALTLRVHLGLAGAAAASEEFSRRHAGDPLLMDKWLSIHATDPRPGAALRVRALLDHPAFQWRNPNKVRALLGAFARSNRVGFHADDGAGYALVADAVLTVDALNPQVAARLAGAFNGWRRIEPRRRARMHAELSRLAGAALSPDTGEIVSRALA